MAQLILTDAASAFLFRNKVKIPNSRMTTHYTDFVQRQLDNITEVRKLAGTSVFPEDIETALTAIENEWKRLLKSAIDNRPKKSLYVNLETFCAEKGITRPDGSLVTCSEEADALRRKIEELLIVEESELSSYLVTTLRRWIGGWKAIARKYSQDFGATQAMSARPSEYLAKKASKSAESVAVRTRMQSRKGQK